METGHFFKNLFAISFKFLFNKKKIYNTLKMAEMCTIIRTAARRLLEAGRFTVENK